jgi:hypothetical protein
VEHAGVLDVVARDHGDEAKTLIRTLNNESHGAPAQPGDRKQLVRRVERLAKAVQAQ